MYKLINKANNEEIGTINETQLQFLLDQLEEETPEDKEYYLHKSILDTFLEIGGDRELLNILANAFGENDEIEVFWEKTEA